MLCFYCQCIELVWYDGLCVPWSSLILRTRIRRRRPLSLKLWLDFHKSRYCWVKTDANRARTSAKSVNEGCLWKLRYISGFMPKPKESPDWTGISGPQAKPAPANSSEKCSIPASEAATDTYMFELNPTHACLSRMKMLDWDPGPAAFWGFRVAFTKPEQKWKANREESSPAARSQSCVVHNGFGGINTPVCGRMEGELINALTWMHTNVICLNRNKTVMVFVLLCL